MTTHRMVTAGMVAALCAALLLPVGCKKKEDPKAVQAAATAAGAVAPGAVAAIPVLPDVELAAGDGVAGWVSLQSLNALFDSTEALGGRLSLLPPGASLRQDVYAGLAAALSSVGVSGHEWLDKGKSIHVGFQDDAPPAAPPAGGIVAAPNPVEGLFVVLHVTDKAKMVGAMATAKKGAEAEGHEALLLAGEQKVFVDFVGPQTVVLTTGAGRFAKVKTFVERLDRVQVPALLYMGVSVEDLAKTRQKEIGQLMAMMEQAGNTEMAGQPQVMQAYSKMLRDWLTDLQRVEVLVNADTKTTKLEWRMHARNGSKLYRQLMAGRGRSPKDVLALMPGNSYLAFGSHVDPAASLETLDETLVLLKDLLKLQDADYKAFVEDIKGAAKLQDGQSALSLYPDGQALFGVSAAVGTTDGTVAVKLVKRLVTGIALRLIAQQKATDAELAAMPQLAIVEKSLSEGKLQPIIDAFGPMAEAAGVKLTINTNEVDGTVCDVLDVQVDFAKLAANAPDSEQVKKVIGDRTAVALCSAKTKVAMTFGPGALEHGKRIALGKPGGLAEAPVFKQAVSDAGPQTSMLLYLNPGLAMATFAKAFPEVPRIQGDRAVTMTCQARARSMGCGLEVPVELIVAIKNAATPPAPVVDPAVAAPAAPMAPAAPAAP